MAESEAWLRVETESSRTGPADAFEPEDRLHPQPDDSGKVHFRVAITAAFLTSHPLDVDFDSYAHVQAALDRELNKDQEPAIPKTEVQSSTPETKKQRKWRVEDLHSVGGTFESGGGFATALPLVIARREGPALKRDLLLALRQSQTSTIGAEPSGSEAPLLDHGATDFDVELDELEIDIYDFGVGVLTAWIDVWAPAEVNPVNVTRIVRERLSWIRPRMGPGSPIAGAIETLAKLTVSEFDGAVRTAVPGNAADAWFTLAPRGDRTGSSSTTPADDRTLLWLHPVWVLEAQDASEAMTLELAPEFREVIRVAKGYFAPGVSWSAIVSNPGADADKAPIRLTQLHWAYYALYMKLDRALLVTCNRARWSTKSLRDHAHAADLQISAPRDWIAETRARLDSELISRGGDEIAIWQAIAEAQRFGVLIDAVDRKMNALEQLTGRIVDQTMVDRRPRTPATLGAEAPGDEVERPQVAGNMRPLELPHVSRGVSAETDGPRDGTSKSVPDDTFSEPQAVDSRQARRIAPSTPVLRKMTYLGIPLLATVARVIVSAGGVAIAGAAVGGALGAALGALLGCGLGLRVSVAASRDR